MSEGIDPVLSVASVIFGPTILPMLLLNSQSLVFLPQPTEYLEELQVHVTILYNQSVCLSICFSSSPLPFFLTVSQNIVKTGINNPPVSALQVLVTCLMSSLPHLALKEKIQ